MIAPIVTFFARHKLAVATLSLLGSLAGLVFSGIDLHDTIKKLKK